jgi:hypothetical protein
MKTKKINKKLFLKKRTISNLNDIELGIARGGESPDSCYGTCYSCPRTCTSNIPKICTTIGDLCP